MIERKIHPSISRDKHRLSVEDVTEIKNIGERVFALAVLQKPHLLVIYEPCVFLSKRGKKTSPDFYVLNLRNPRSVGTFIEVTQAAELDKRKGNQLDVIKNLETTEKKVRYLQFNGPVLAELQDSLFRLGVIDQRHSPLHKRIRKKVECRKVVSD